MTRRIDRGAVLDAYASPSRPSAGVIAKAMGIHKASVLLFVAEARIAGDPRAAERPPALKVKDPRVVGTGRLVMHDAVLDAWARPDAPTGADLALRHGVTRHCIEAIILRARKRGDPRAVQRPKTFKRGGTFKAFYIGCRDAGVSVERMAKLSGRTPREVSARLSRIDWDARREMQDAAGQGSLA